MSGGGRESNPPGNGDRPLVGFEGRGTHQASGHLPICVASAAYRFCLVVCAVYLSAKTSRHALSPLAFLLVVGAVYRKVGSYLCGT